MDTFNNLLNNVLSTPSLGDMASLSNDSLGVDTPNAQKSTYEYIYIGIGLVGMLDNLIVVVIMLRVTTMRSKLLNVYIANQSAIDFSSSFFLVMSSTVNGQYVSMPKSPMICTYQEIIYHSASMMIVCFVDIPELEVNVSPVFSTPHLCISH